MPGIQVTDYGNGTASIAYLLDGIEFHRELFDYSQYVQSQGTFFVHWI